MKKASAGSSLKKIINCALNSLNAHTCALFLIQKRQILGLKEYLSLSDFIIDNCTIEKDNGPVAWVMREQKGLSISKFKRDSRSLGYYSKDVGIKSFLAVPLPKKEGVLCADSKTRHFFTEKHQKILLNFADSIAVLLEAERVKKENTLLLEIINWQNRRFDDFKEILRATLELLNLEYCFICRYIQGKNFYVIKGGVSKGKDIFFKFRDKKFELGRGIGGWIFKNKSDMQMYLDGKNKHFSFIFDREEDIKDIDYVLGFFHPSKKQEIPIDHALIFCGKGLSFALKEGLIKSIKERISVEAPWHYVP